MNVAIAKAESAIAEESDATRPGNPPTDNPASTPEFVDEPLLDENTNRRLYRRSAAYFFFGFGCNQHSIVTDEPSN